MSPKLVSNCLCMCVRVYKYAHMRFAYDTGAAYVRGYPSMTSTSTDAGVVDFVLQLSASEPPYARVTAAGHGTTGPWEAWALDKGEMGISALGPSPQLPTERARSYKGASRAASPSFCILDVCHNFSIGLRSRHIPWCMLYQLKKANINSSTNDAHDDTNELTLVTYAVSRKS